MDIIEELSGLASKYRQSAPYAAREIIHAGQPLFDLVFDKALAGGGVLSLRCIEACERAAREKPEFIAKRKKELLKAFFSPPDKEYRFFLAGLIRHAGLTKSETQKCAPVLYEWLKEEKVKGPKAAFLEAIIRLAVIDPALKGKAAVYINEALSSKVPSYSARARVVLKELGMTSEFEAG